MGILLRWEAIAAANRGKSARREEAAVTATGEHNRSILTGIQSPLSSPEMLLPHRLISRIAGLVRSNVTETYPCPFGWKGMRLGQKALKGSIPGANRTASDRSWQLCKDCE